MRRGAWLGLAAFGLSLSADAADPAADWFARISDAARTTNYQGVIVYQTRERMETLKVVHRYEDGQEVERVQALTGDPREILKKGNQVICLLPKDRKVTLQLPTPKGLFPGMTPERIAQLAQYYDFKELGETRIAGRTCRGMAILPRDEYRYGYEIWADRDTAVPVKVNLRGARGAVIEQLMFTQIDFPKRIADAALRTELDPEKYRKVTRELREPPVPTASGRDVAADTRFARLPPGYQIAAREVRPSADGHGMVEHLVLSDGLSAISVFSARRKLPAQGLQGISQIGAVSAYGRRIGSMHVTVVGEVPSAAVQLVGEGARPGAGGAAAGTPGPAPAAVPVPSPLPAPRD